MKLHKLINELEGWIDKRALQDSKFSESTIGWQIAHSLKVLNSMIKTLGKSNPKEYQWKFNFKRVLILSSGYIPKGSAKAPKAVRPEEAELTEAELRVLVEKVRTRLEPVFDYPAKSYMEHPYFGALHLKNSLRFMEIHTNHHLKIICQIGQ